MFYRFTFLVQSQMVIINPIAFFASVLGAEVVPGGGCDIFAPIFAPFNIGFHFSFENESETYLQIFDERIQFAIHEKVKRTDHLPTKKELKDIERAPWMGPHRWDYTPTGKLYIIIDTWGVDKIRRKWSDTASKRVEELINNFIAGTFKASYFLRKERLKREEESRRRREKQARLADEARLREIEKQRQINLENHAVEWEKCNQIRNFIKEVEARASEMKCSSESSIKIKKWISWSNKHADRIDPLHNDHLLEFINSFQT